MSPVPLIDLQRRLSLVGAIRAGGQKPERGVGRKLENWRITSPRQQLIEQAAELFGGAISSWESPVGQEWQVYTETPELPVLLMPSFSLKQTYELWEGVTKRTRLCDGTDEELTGGPCICNTEGTDRCDIYTRLVVAMPDLDTMLGWRVITKGVNAAHELPMMFDAAKAVTSSPFVPARLRLEQRRGVVDGQVVRFVVPTLDLGVGYAALAANAHPMPALTPGALALTEGAESNGDGDGAVVPFASANPRTRRAAGFGPESISPEEASAPEVPGGDGASKSDQEPAASDAQKKKLNMLVGTLREAGHITTDGIYNAVATRLRNTHGLDLAQTLGAIDTDGKTHWTLLRESLTRVEASTLIDWLEKLEARETTAAPETAIEKKASEPEPEPTGKMTKEQVEAVYNEFPPGY